MKQFSNLSIVFIFIGIVLLGVNYFSTNFNELIVLFGYISIILGVINSYIAIMKKETGSLKYLSIGSFFVVLLLITLFDPFQLLRVLTWINN
ncbi:hypothetical protein J5Y03_15490 [Bacillus sp. RG28]|uniref:Uncharacterized protein n=1 Tax=Gottfriedia endophytica TaxID=2820819 RepID=A0A940NJQ1_9BACI|nr:hypothetical protein [Gottfriedia endophytica]MBP0726564.1 hypothetical protein [Gottfriedia endophytica]